MSRFDAIEDATDAQVLHVQHTFTQEDVGLSARRPVRIVSHIHGSHKPRSVAIGSPGHPGAHWGPVRYVPRRDDHTPAHNHQFCEITFIRNGSAVHEGIGHEREIAAGTVIVVPLGMAQQYRQIRNLEYTNLYYLSEWLVDDLRLWWAESGLVPLFLATSLFNRGLIHDTPLLTLSKTELIKVDRELEDIAQEVAGDEPSLIFLRGALLKLFTLLARSFVSSAPDRRSLPFRSEIWIALQHIEDQLARSEPFSPDTVASACLLSRNRFSTVFKEATGLSPTDYYQRRRVQRSTQLLLDPDKSVSEVAHQLGYADASHFGNLFKRYRGMTPKAYRKLYLPD